MVTDAGKAILLMGSCEKCILQYLINQSAESEIMANWFLKKNLARELTYDCCTLD